MRESGMTVAFLGFWQSHLPPERWADFEQELLNEVHSVPGVLNAATTTHVPLWPGSWEHGIHVGATDGSSKFAWVSPEYFSTMDIPVIRGRGFNQNDTMSSLRVALVNETFALFVDKATAADFLAKRVGSEEFVNRAKFNLFDGESLVGRVPLEVWEDSFNTTYKIGNYDPPKGAQCQ